MHEGESMIGQEKNVEHLQKAIEHDKISHAYIFSGEAGMGKKMLAKNFAMTLECEEMGSEPCMKCKSCKQALSMNHPDIKWVTHEKPATISVDDIRLQINNDIVIKPYSSKYKIYIVDDAEKMSPAAQNALLKTIEEPPVYGIIVLLTTNSNMLLPTIISRCVELSMRSIDIDTICNFLKSEHGIDDYRAKMAAVFSGGNLGKAVKLATSDHFTELKNDVMSLTKNINKMTAADMGAVIKNTENYKLEMDDYLDLLRIWYRDVLMYKVTKDADSVVFRDEIQALSDQAAKVEFNGLEDIIEAIDRVKIRLSSNVNFELVIELLFLAIREQFM